MIYTCQICGAGFKKEQLEPAIKSKAKFITCNYCGNDNDFGSMETSHIARGYERLEYGDFFGAKLQFSEATKAVEHLDPGSMPKQACIEAFFGLALANFSVQVIYNEEVAELDNPLETNCFVCNEDYFEDSYDYQVALSIAMAIRDNDLRAGTISRFDRFAKKIDKIKKRYEKRAIQNIKYQLFIACEDKSKDSVASLNMANKIGNELPDEIKRDKVFIMNPDEYLGDTDYEGDILYAIHNSTCMLVVTDKDVDARLMNIYNRFCKVKAANHDKHENKSLFFVRYQGATHILLDDPTITPNIFEYDDLEEYHDFICEANNIFRLKKKSTGTHQVIINDIEGFTVTSKNPVEVRDGADVYFDISIDRDYEFDSVSIGEYNSASGKLIIRNVKKPINVSFRVKYIGDVKGDPPQFDTTGKHCIFGSYPQRKLHDLEAKQIESHFLPKPNALSYDGWEVMFTSKTGRPYTWYKDKEIDGKKYRAVCFARYRDVFTYREFDRPGLTVQFGAGYKNSTIYIFEYSPIEWNVLEEGMNSATLVTSVGLDAHDYNSDFCSIWECTTLRTWLNEDFLNTAFSENQKKFLFHSEDEYVFLIDRKRDLGQIDFRDKLNTYNIRCTDYFGCVGGRSFNGDVCNFWIKDENDEGDSASAVQPHAVGSIIPLGIDNTTVAVIPKIKVRR